VKQITKRLQEIKQQELLRDWREVREFRRGLLVEIDKVGLNWFLEAIVVVVCGGCLGRLKGVAEKRSLKFQSFL
jgi:hypothetical protein